MEMYSDNQNVITNEATNQNVVKTFFRMFLGLLATAIMSVITYSTGAIEEVYMYFPFLAIAEIVVVLVFSLAFRKLSSTVVTILFFVYAILNGLTLSTIFLAYDIGTIAYAFGATTVLFGGLAAYGHFTKKDVTKFGTICLWGLLAGLITSLVNLVIGSTMLDIIINWAMIIIFCGLTIYDMNKIKYIEGYGEHEAEKMYVYCAMDLYLDFINLFLKLLRLFARRRD